MTDANDKPIDIFEDDEPPALNVRTGFLPIQTNWFDRIFISVVIWVALCLLWLRFIEPAGLSLHFANGIAVLLGVFIVWKG